MTKYIHRVVTVYSFTSSTMNGAITDGSDAQLLVELLDDEYEIDAAIPVCSMGNAGVQYVLSKETHD